MVRLFYHIEKIDVRRKTLVVSRKISIKKRVALRSKPFSILADV